MIVKHLLLPALLAGLIVTGAPPRTAMAQVRPVPTLAGCPAPLQRWTEIDLYLGRNIAGVGEVSEGQFRDFLAGVVTRQFPDGLSVADIAGQFRDGNRIVRERTKLLVLLVPDAAEAAPRVKRVVDAYKRRFSQQSVLRTETSVCLAFD